MKSRIKSLSISSTVVLVLKLLFILNCFALFFVSIDMAVVVAQTDYFFVFVGLMVFGLALFVFIHVLRIKAIRYNKDEQILLVKDFITSKSYSFNQVIAFDATQPYLYKIILRQKSKIYTIPSISNTMSGGTIPKIVKEFSEVLSKYGVNCYTYQKKYNPYDFFKL